MHEQAAFAEGNAGDHRVAILAAGAATLEIATPAHGRSVDRIEGMGQARGPRIRLAFEVTDAVAATADAVESGAVEVAAPTRTPWQSRNSRLAAPGDLQITLFQELEP
jgi:hypothetical protein